MKRNLLKMAVAIVLISGITSCMAVKEQSNCPSHDKNYFRKYGR